MAIDYKSMKVAELKELLKARGLPQTGVKADLVAHLEQDDQAKAAASSQPVSAVAPPAPTEATKSTAPASAAPSTGAPTTSVAEPGSTPIEQTSKSGFQYKSVAALFGDASAPKPAETAAALTTANTKAVNVEESKSAEPAPVFSANLPPTDIQSEIEKRLKRFERFAIKEVTPSTTGVPEDSEEAKKLARLAKFSSADGEAPTGTSILGGLDAPLSDGKKRGRDVGGHGDHKRQRFGAGGRGGRGGARGGGGGRGGTDKGRAPAAATDSGEQARIDARKAKFGAAK